MSDGTYSVYEYENLTEEVFLAYKLRLQAHIAAVQKYGHRLIRLGLNIDQLNRHDESKWQPIEFESYALRFCSGLPKEETALYFSQGWLHHIHHNPHHWQHWMFPDRFDLVGADLENGVMAMPEHYALEMVADWHGAGYVYEQDWDISNWLFSNAPRVILHSRTAEFLTGVMRRLGYSENLLNWGVAANL